MSFCGYTFVMVSSAPQVGLVCALCAMEVVHSGIAALFVCFAEDPAAFAATKPQVYAKFGAAWAARYGGDQMGFVAVV